MIPLYENYLPSPQSLPLREMIRLHTEMADEIGSDPDCLELYDELTDNAIRYAAFRARWLLWSPAEKMAQDAGRSACHDSLIVKFNQLARYLRIQGKPAAWRDVLGYEENDRCFRKRIGDFACYIAFINGISAR